nr:zinc finger FYVE domain-containing protein 16-like [Ipomoea batatas]
MDMLEEYRTQHRRLENPESESSVSQEIVKTEDFVSKISLQDTEECGKNYCLKSEKQESEESGVASSQHNFMEKYERKGDIGQGLKTEEYTSEHLNQNETFLCHHLAESTASGIELPPSSEKKSHENDEPSVAKTENGEREANLPQRTCKENYEDNFSVDQQIDRARDSYTESYQSTVEDNPNKSPQKQCKYFSYDAPLYGETGIWIPVSVPPLSESDHEEWTRGFFSKEEYFPEEDMGSIQCSGEDRELTMWDVVVEMLLVARGKVSTLTSGDICNISWISGHLVEQAWKEMAQTLTEANFGSTRELLEAEPPKWLPDSAASSCMLCSVRFHPIMCSRHHCRFCGGIFCGDCTRGRSLLPEKFRTEQPQRVCDVCSVRLQSVQAYLMDQVSRAAQLPTHDLTDLSTLRSWINFPWGQSMEYEIYKATNTIRSYNTVGSLGNEKRIPEAILRGAHGLAILTVVKVGVMVTYNIGTGLVVARREDGSWSPPSAISSFGVGWGAQAGGELTDFIIVLRTNDAVKTFSGEAHISIGAGVSAAAGVIGRTAEADVRAGTGGYSACYTYSCSKGAFVGVSLEGSVVTTRSRENSRFYGSQSVSAADILLGSWPRPPAAATLYRALAELYQKL